MMNTTTRALDAVIADLIAEGFDRADVLGAIDSLATVQSVETIDDDDVEVLRQQMLSQADRLDWDMIPEEIDEHVSVERDGIWTVTAANGETMRAAYDTATGTPGYSWSFYDVDGEERDSDGCNGTDPAPVVAAMLAFVRAAQ